MKIVALKLLLYVGLPLLILAQLSVALASFDTPKTMLHAGVNVVWAVGLMFWVRDLMKGS